SVKSTTCTYWPSASHFLYDEVTVILSFFFISYMNYTKQFRINRVCSSTALHHVNKFQCAIAAASEKLAWLIHGMEKKCRMRKDLLQFQCE
ncbi:hypothetical protein STEG23_001792, partial [Scotinomys teguina]